MTAQTNRNRVQIIIEMIVIYHAVGSRISFYRMLTRSLSQPVNFPGGKVHTYTPAYSIFDSPITTQLSILCSLVEVLSRGHAKRGKIRNNFKFDTSVGRFSSDGAASTAVKGLRQLE